MDITEQTATGDEVETTQAYADRHGLNLVEAYAVQLVADGAESTAEDDLDEDGVFDTVTDHEAACDLALRIAAAIRANPHTILALVPP